MNLHIDRTLLLEHSNSYNPYSSSTKPEVVMKNKRQCVLSQSKQNKEEEIVKPKQWEFTFDNNSICSQNINSRITKADFCIIPNCLKNNLKIKEVRGLILFCSKVRYYRKWAKRIKWKVVYAC